MRAISKTLGFLRVQRYLRASKPVAFRSPIDRLLSKYLPNRPQIGTSRKGAKAEGAMERGSEARSEDRWPWCSEIQDVNERAWMDVSIRV
jgi:hypothetical protein